VNLAGDVLNSSLVEDLAGASANCKVYNHYGPSETTTYAMGACIAGIGDAARSKGGRLGGARAPTIGWPIAGVEVYVADRYLNLVPIGVTGELFIGGVSLARGYIGRPGLTAERFIPDPWSGQPGARVYQTGDLVRYRRDGSLDFLRRTDRQVKIRGFRIELGEIESVLNAHPRVYQSFARVLDEPDEEKRLVAYYVSRGKKSLDPQELAIYVRSKIPPAMIPGLLIPLESVPLTSNGKVDREALPTPWRRRTGAPQPRLEPANSVVESILVEQWAQVLGTTIVGVTEDFFTLGGSSMQMVTLAARLYQAFGVQVSLADLLANTTIRQQAPVVQALLGSGGESELWLAYCNSAGRS